MTDEQRKQVDELIRIGKANLEAGENACETCPMATLAMYYSHASAASSLAIAIMLREMLDKPQPFRSPATPANILQRVANTWDCTCGSVLLIEDTCSTCGRKRPSADNAHATGQ